ncbi:Transcriptional regulator, TetR family protein [Minicystis rosea]|nr:Transcriptional regulator, TetR family protein [Minicystis rosea]
MALQLFANEGFHGTSIRDIVKVLELQPSAVYAHFPSKEHILSELVRLGHEVLELALEAALREAGSDPIERVRALVRTHAVLHATYPHLAVVVNEEIRFLTRELAAPALALRAQSASLLRQVVEAGIAAGTFSPPDTAATAAAISAMGVRIPYWYDATPGLDIEALAETHVELALRMLGAAKPKKPPRRA